MRAESIEINRTTPVRDEITDVEAARDHPARTAVLLNRCVTRANSTGYARAALQDLGYDVLGTAVPRLEVYAQSFGIPIPVRGRGVWGRVARDLAGRCVPLRPTASLPGRRRSAKRGSPPRRGIHYRVSTPRLRGREPAA